VIVRLAAILFAMLLSAQAVLPGGAVWVCRYTGQRIEPCACPETRPPDDAHLRPQGCCELRQGQHTDVPGLLPGLDSRLPVLALAVPVQPPAPSPQPLEEPGARVRAGHDPPPRERLFLSLRQWLI
jgi:hypothetical protein